MNFMNIVPLSLTVVLTCGAQGKIDENTYAITGKNLAALKSLPIRVYLPSSIPSDYALFDYTVENEVSGSPNYAVTFLKDKSHWFQIDSSDTVGDSDWEDATRTESKCDAFGKFAIQWAAQGRPGEVIQTSHVITSWLTSPGSHSKGKPFRFYQVVGRGLTAVEATSIVKSLKLQN